MKIHITKNTFHWKLDFESLSTAPVWCFMLSTELLKHNGKWVIVHYMAFVFRYEILTSEKRVVSSWWRAQRQGCGREARGEEGDRRVGIWQLLFQWISLNLGFLATNPGKFTHLTGWREEALGS